MLADLLPPTPICVGCGAHPGQLNEYVRAAAEESEDLPYTLTPDDYVRREEGTYNRDNGHFWCTPCYVKAGQPLGKAP